MKSIVLLFLCATPFGLLTQFGPDDISIDTLASQPENIKNSMHDPAIEIEYSTWKIYYGGENGIYSSTDNGKT